MWTCFSILKDYLTLSLSETDLQTLALNGYLMEFRIITADVDGNYQ